jgi:hypothetical protein
MKEEIEKIAGKIKCPKNFVCYKSGFENLCQVKDVGLDQHLLCLEEHSQIKCPYSVPFGRKIYCDCPLRVYICKRLKK